MKTVFFYFLLVAFFFAPENMVAQSFAINTDGSTANASALLDIKSTDKGMLVPRMSKAQRNAIATPATGLLVFQNAPDSIGFYYYNGTGWLWLTTTSQQDTVAWRTKGNTVGFDNSSFIGTIDSIPLNVRVNNQRAGRIDHILSNSFWGYQAGNANTTGNQNTATGRNGLYANTTGFWNTANGMNSLLNNTTGNYNAALGAYSLSNNVTGTSNAGFGTNSLA